MRNLSDVLATQNANCDDISQVIDLSQIKNLDSVKLWSRRGETRPVLSDVSSESNKRSVISEDPDSVSAMTSSQSEGSVESLEEMGAAKSRQSGYAPGQKDAYPPASAGTAEANDAHLGELLDMDNHIDAVRQIMGELTGTLKSLLAQSSLNVDSALRCSFPSFARLQAKLCILSSLDLLYRNSDQIGRVTWNRLMDTYKDSYSELLTLSTHLCKLMSEQVGADIVARALELLPYVMDALLCILLSLLRHLEEQDAKRDLTSVLERVLKYSLVICCGYLDHSNESLDRMAALSIYRLTLTFLPLQLVYAVGAEAQPAEARPDARVLGSLAELLKEEYLKDEFKPSGVLLYKLRAEKYSAGGAEHEAMAVRSLAAAMEVCIRAGVSRRQYPTSQIDPVGCFDLLVSSPFEDLWARLNYWLLKASESALPQVRRTSLLILRHALCTLKFAEREMQYVLSHVYNSLSDDEAIPEALAVLSALSRIYPLKDGAVRRIVNLTLKGSRTSVRPRVFEFFSQCRYTQKGLTFLVSVYMTLSQSLASGSLGSGLTAPNSTGNSAPASEFNFTVNEWPLMVDSLVALARSCSWVGPIDTARLVSDEYQQCLKRRKLGPVTPGLWISFLWNYLANASDDRLRVLKCLVFPEARARFPRIVKSLSEADRVAFTSYLKGREGLSSLEGFAKERVLDFVKDQNKWKAHHQVNVPYSAYHLERTAAVFNDIYSVQTDQGRAKVLEDRPAEGSCNCVDCRMDYIICDYSKIAAKQQAHSAQMGVQNHTATPLDMLDTVLDVLEGPGLCERHPRERPGDGQLEIVSHTINAFDYSGPETSLVTSNEPTQSLRLKAFKVSVDDVICLRFPSQIGAEVSFKVVVKSPKYPSNLAFFYRLPRVIDAGFGSHKDSFGKQFGSAVGSFDSPGAGRAKFAPPRLVRPSFEADDRDKALYNATVTFTVSIPFQTPCPLRMDVFSRNEGVDRMLGFVWVHPKRVA